MTDGAMFYPLFKILQENKVYCPKINNADVYSDFIEKNYENNELENKYQDYTKLYDNTFLHFKRRFLYSPKPYKNHL